jgi:hypothetical protein
VVATADEDSLEKHGWQQTVSLHRGDISFNAHRRHEGDVAQGAGADPHVLWWQNSKGPLFLDHAASLQGGLLQDPTSGVSVLSCLPVIQDQPRTEHISEMGTSRQHGFVKRYGLVRDDRHEAPPVMVPFRRSPARPFAVLPHHRLGVLPLGSP